MHVVVLTKKQNTQTNQIMGASTVTFIAIEEKAILEIMPKVINALNVWQRNLLDEYWKKESFENRAQFLFRNKEDGANVGLKDFSNGISSVSTVDFRSFNINFTVEGEQRQLFITHTCSGDYSEFYKGEKIIFSIGYWGLSAEIMAVIHKSIKGMGDVYYTLNDCEFDFEKLKQ